MFNLGNGEDLDGELERYVLDEYILEDVFAMQLKSGGVDKFSLKRIPRSLRFMQFHMRNLLDDPE